MRYQTGQDAPVSVLTEALYSQLPALTSLQREELQGDFAHRFGVNADPLTGGGRKLLTFSDSRQNAAFMASYLQDHAREYLIRELSYDALSDDDQLMTLSDWANAVLKRSCPFSESQIQHTVLPFLRVSFATRCRGAGLFG